MTPTLNVKRPNLYTRESTEPSGFPWQAAFTQGVSRQGERGMNSMTEAGGALGYSHNLYTDFEDVKRP